MKKLITCLTLIIIYSINTYTVFGSNASIGSGNQTFSNGNICKSGIFVIKMKSAFRSACSLNNIEQPRMKEAFNKISAYGVTKKYPRSTAPAESVNAFRQKLVDLSLIYQIQFSTVIKIEEAIQLIKSTGMVEYAEPLYIHQLDFIPNDPSIAGQYH